MRVGDPCRQIEAQDPVDRDAHHLSAAQGASRHVRDTVDVRRLRRDSTSGLAGRAATAALDEHLDGAAHLTLPEGARRALGGGAQASSTLLAQGDRHLLRQASRRRALLRVERKDAGDRQTRRRHELQQLLELLFRLARETR